MQTPYILGMDFSTFVRSVKLYCHEKGIPYQSGMMYNNRPVQLHDQIHYQLHPFGKVPILLHNNQTIIETTTICRYLDQQFPNTSLEPKLSHERTAVDLWSNLLVYYFDPILIRQYLLEFTFPKGENGTIRLEQIKKIEPQVLASLQQLSQQLANKLFFINHHYTMADAILTPILDYLMRLPHAERLLQSTPNLVAYCNTMKNRPSGLKVYQTKQ